MSSLEPSSPKGSNGKKIIIPIKESTDARVFPGDRRRKLIQQDALNVLTARVSETLERIKSFKDELKSNAKRDRWERLRHHDIITISGGRGTGKTTFVLNALHSLEAEDKFGLKKLGILDPTLVDCKESFILNITSRINEVVDGERGENGDKDNDLYDEYEKALRRLAEGLAQLNGIGTKALTHDTWDDPLFIMQEGLNNAQQGEKLEEHFHLFLNKALECLEKTAFILAFDDIDTNFSKGWDVLEIIRKYLTSPQLIILLCGDYDLYSKLVRMNQWAHFGAQFLRKEMDSGINIETFKNRVDSLEDQYLLKILKPSRRIELKSLEIVMRDYAVYVELLKKEAEDDPIELSRYLTKKLEDHYYLTPSSHLEKAIEHLLKQPVRTVVQVLRGFNDLHETSKDNPFAVHEHMARIFATAIGHMGFTWPKDIPFARKRIGMPMLATRLIESHLLEDGAALSPTLGTDDRNSMALIMGGYYATAIRETPSLFADYFIKVLLTRDTISGEPQTKQSEFAESIGLGIDEGAVLTAHRHAAETQQIVYKSGQRPIIQGYLRLSGEWIKRQNALERVCNLWGVKLESLDGEPNEIIDKAKKGKLSPHLTEFLSETVQQRIGIKKGQYIRRYYNTVETLSNGINCWHKSIANLLIAGIDDGGQNNASFLSGYQLVALIGLLAETSEDELPAVLGNYISPTRRKVKLERDEIKKEKPDEDESDSAQIEESDLQVSFSDNSFSEFMYAIKKWKTSFHPPVALPTSTYAKIWDKYQSTILGIAENLDDLHAGFVLHRFAVALLNAIFVEECQYLYSNTLQLNLTRPITRDSVLLYNINLFNEHKIDLKVTAKGSSLSKNYENLPLFTWVLSCPIWSILLDPNSELMRYHNKHKFTDYNYAEVTYGNAKLNNLYPLLNTLMVPYDHTSRERNEPIRSPEIDYDELREAMDSLTPLEEIPKDIQNIYYRKAKEWLNADFDKVKSLLSAKKIHTIPSLTSTARVDIFRNIMAKHNEIYSETVKPSTNNGQAYLRAFMEVFLEQME